MSILKITIIEKKFTCKGYSYHDINGFKKIVISETWNGLVTIFNFGSLYVINQRIISSDD